MNVTETPACPGMEARPEDLDRTRAAIAARELVGTASGYLTGEVAVHLPFEALGPYKNALKRYFSVEPWQRADAAALSELVAPHVESGWWEHDLGAGITLAHGIRDGRYELWVGGATAVAPSIFERAFAGPVVPEATPHPRKVRFAIGGTPRPGRWFRRTDPDPPPDPRVRRLFAEADVSDVMVAGDFVTVGITGSWEHRLEPLLALVTELFSRPGEVRSNGVRTRDELLREAGHLHPATSLEELHLLDPNDPDHCEVLTAALGQGDTKARRVAVAVLAEADDPSVQAEAVALGARDKSLLVRRTALDAAADTEDPAFRPLFEATLADPDPWMRWRAVRALGGIGVEASRVAVSALASDPEFRVRFEVAQVLRNDA